MESADMQLVMFALIATIPLVGAMMAITPLLQPNGQAFSVSVPEVAQSDPGIRVLKQRFVAIIAALTAILTLAAVAFCLMGSMKAVMALVVAGSLAPLVVGYGLIVRYRRCVQAIKRERGWQADAQQHVAAIGEGVEDAPRAISLAWNWLYAPVILLTVGVAIAGYPVMPAQIPVHVDFSGAVTDVASKSPVVAAFPIALELFWPAASCSPIGRCCVRKRESSRVIRRVLLGRTGCSLTRKLCFCWWAVWLSRRFAAFSSSFP